jgi:hypothetical protein
MKIAEKYGELFYNEWTDAMGYTDDAMSKLFPAVDHPLFDEILVYHLYRLVMVCLCFDLNFPHMYKGVVVVIVW